MMQCEGSWMIPLTVRPEHLKHHGGQVCFPGGECDPGQTMEVAAAREWHEELGVDGDALEFVGRLAPVHVFASNYIVAPCVAVAPRQQFRPSADEVDEIVWLDPTTPPIPHGTQTIERGSLCFQTPYLECGGRRVWGATAVMLGELLTRLAPHTHRGD
jgi:8-oxo-dGTP pyrophosphatase MutT (NUDIX family)